MATEFFMPKMTDHMEAGVIINWLVKEGQVVEKGQPLLEIETDKATVELESPASGILREVRPGAVPGASVPVGETLAFVAGAKEKVPPLPPLSGGGIAKAPQPMEASSAAPEVPHTARIEVGPPRASPAVRKLARDLGVDLAMLRGSGAEGRISERDVRTYLADQQAAKAPQKVGAGQASPLARRMADDMGIDLSKVKGSGPQGRLTREDVKAYAQAPVPTQPPAAAPRIDTPAGELGWLDLSTVQRLTGQRMLESFQNAPQFALGVDVDMTAALLFRQAHQERLQSEVGERPSVTVILVRAVAFALKHFPRANASFDNGRIKLHRQVNIGVAIGTDEGLMVPVIKDADRKTLGQITHELREFQEKAASMRFNPEDLAGGTFTISNLGMYGIDRFHAIINPPESAILAVGRIVRSPVGMPDDTIALRPMMSLTLSIDHRSMDGIQGAGFLAKLKEMLEQPYLLVE
jgi:pyruvate dehydrogenase E2 component (dihydrolipoamide acetyltransferase)